MNFGGKRSDEGRLAHFCQSKKNGDLTGISLKLKSVRVCLAEVSHKKISEKRNELYVLKNTWFYRALGGGNWEIFKIGHFAVSLLCRTKLGKNNEIVLMWDSHMV